MTAKIVTKDTVKNNSLRVTNPNLINEWYFEKNNELGIDIQKITHGSDKVVWWICPDCGSDYDMKIEFRARKNVGCPYCSGKRVNHTNSLASLNPELALQWHPTLNGDLTPHDVTLKSNKKVWWMGTCSHEWESVVHSRVCGNDCPYCAGQKVNHTNSLTILNPELASQWHPTKNGELTPNDVPKSARRKVWWKCDLGHEWESAIYSRSTGIGCPYCANKKVLVGFNDMWTTNPRLASLLTDPNDGYKCTQSSNKNVSWKCIWCKTVVKNIRANQAISNPPCCDSCKVGKSFGEKLLGNILYVNNIDFTREKIFNWSNGKKYDFYLYKLNILIEVHGSQHYNGGFESMGGKSLKEEQDNDKYKQDVAILNGISPNNYIVIDTSISDYEFIVDNVRKSSLSELLDEENYKEALSIKVDPLIIKASELYSTNGMNVSEIANHIKCSNTTVHKLLRNGKYIGLNNYEPHGRKKGIEIVQLDLNFNESSRWNSTKEARLFKNVKSITISDINKVVVSRGYIWCRRSELNQFLNKFKRG